MNLKSVAIDNTSIVSDRFLSCYPGSVSMQKDDELMFSGKNFGVATDSDLYVNRDGGAGVVDLVVFFLEHCQGGAKNLYSRFFSDFFSKEDWMDIEETLFIKSMPGLVDDIKAGLAQDINECSDELDW